ncbi:pentapeptide repeat-containing protein [Leptolyngbya sp. FACHB-711]|uniref:pentapeptide repeat-containing protein n=1 Tax=unclassified Leptolyngbya TaxID=2650499 RepID=UPI0016836AF5|nr:pentapeptide repeat-containing protein [Leptolyngbya sp. FACHB-711]MBD1850886.1 pentapeptide repeat-containing protein [Cyanobacteria bacterium FACHB-502]MBD2027809.1 pentapeptide repeat-containing protein [Leptolyngbya sp. FACHB-711]
MVEADEIVRLYQQGERNFSRLNLSGLSFQGQDLSGADFTQANLRGTTFRRSVLRGANFAGARIGLRLRGKILLTLGLLVLAALLGIGAGIMGTIVNLEIRVHTTRFEEIIAGWTTLLLLIGYTFVSTRHGLKAGFSLFLIAFAVAVSVAATGPLIATLINPIAFSIAFAIANAITIVLTVLAATVTATVLATGGWAAIGMGSAALIIAVFILGFASTVAITHIVASIVAVVPCVLMLTGYQCWRALKGDGQHSMIRQAVTALTVQWGTSFQSADLTDASFTGTRLHNANFDNAILTRTCWANGARTASIHAIGSPFAFLG